MQGNRGGRNPFSEFGDPFAGFGAFGGFSGQRSLISSFFGGRDPFDDPFFTQPFGGLFESSFFGSTGSRFMQAHPSSLIEHQPQEPVRSRGPIIEELDSDGEKEVDNERKENTRKHGRSSEVPLVEDPDDEVEERRSKLRHYVNDHRNWQSERQIQPQSHSFTFQSSTISYGGANGRYYTSSTTRRTGSDGVAFEESKEADSATMQATHRISKGLRNKGHSLTRKLNSDGKVDTMETLHNINEDELPHFEQAWKGNARKHLPGWGVHFDGQNGQGAGQNGRAQQAGWALPSTEQSYSGQKMLPDFPEQAESSQRQHAGRLKANVREKAGRSHERAMRG